MQKRTKSTQSPRYPLDQLIHLWNTEQISMEQLCEQLLMWVQRLRERQVAYEREEENVHHNLADLDERLEKVERSRSR